MPKRRSSLLNETEQFWFEWFKTPEQLGVEVFEGYGHDKDGKLLGSRIFLTGYPSFLNYLERMQKGVFPCWMSVLTFSGRDEPIILCKLYFDFDSKNLELTWKEARDFAQRLRRFHNADSLICFSGNKGFNVYVWLQKHLTFTKGSKFSIKEVYSKIQEILLKGTKYETLDPNPLGDVKRVSRVPYSIHQGSGLLCTPVNIDREPLSLQSLKGYQENGLSEQFIDFCLRKLEEEEQQHEEKKKRWINKENPFGDNTNTPSIRPCIQAALNVDLVEKQGTKMRLAVAREFLAVKWKTEDIVQLFKNQDNFNEETTKERIEDLKKEAESTDEKKREKAKPFKCKTIISLGFCLKENCALWRWKTERGIEP
jgi:hypothetical protein